MKKKLLSLMLASALALGVAGGLSACGPEPAPEVPATGITLDRTTMSLNLDDQKGIIATLAPANATTPIVWTSSNEKVAPVMDGLVTGNNKGTAVITAKVGEYEAKCTVTVSGEWTEYYVVGEKGTVVGGSAIAWDGGNAPEEKDATKKFKQDENDPRKWTITIDFEEGANFKITRFKGGWDPAIGASDDEKAKNKTVTATGSSVDVVSKNNAPNIAVEAAGRYTFTLQFKLGGAIDSFTYTRVDIPAA